MRVQSKFQTDYKLCNDLPSTNEVIFRPQHSLTSVSSHRGSAEGNPVIFAEMKSMVIKEEVPANNVPVRR